MAEGSIVDEAPALFALLADSRLVDEVEDLVATGHAEWRTDPHVDGVVALVDPTHPFRALVVLYTESEDFEHDATFFTN